MTNENGVWGEENFVDDFGFACCGLVAAAEFKRFNAERIEERRRKSGER